ncbi:orexin receptor type 2-like [Mercenaria mercenaria]|uniref:orexin receptor type 2-like n=1 Tax=Mercenaria mercenaria TaxID=6596 RepID=UPI001E1D4288|nr:orexin receptor type 2-like [Mercenaria mercenaria]
MNETKMTNITINGCTQKLTNNSYNVNSSDLYMEECLGLICIPVVECTKYIEEHVTPGATEWVIISIYSVIFLVGLIGNGLVCFVVIRVSHMRTIVNIFIVNLAVADFLVLLICMPPSVLTDTTESWYLGDIMCKVVPFLQTVSVAVSVLTLGAIAVERYFAICHPLRRRLNSLTVTIVIVVIWITAICVSLPELIYQTLNRWYPEYVTDYLQYCQQSLSKEKQKYYQIFLMIGLYDVPMCLIFFAYSTIALRLWKDTFSTEHTNGRLNAGRRPQFSASRPESQLNARRKAAKMLMTIVVLFGTCYLPIHIFQILRYNGDLYEWDDAVVTTYALIARGLCYLNSALNPIIYNFMSAKFRQEFRAAFSRCHAPFQDPVKAPVNVYNFRITRTNGQTRSERYSMNTYSTRQNWNVNNTGSSKRSQF